MYDVVCMQIYVEIERARLTRQLAQMQEQDGKISEAADTLQEIAVVRVQLLLTNNALVCVVYLLANAEQIL